MTAFKKYTLLAIIFIIVFGSIYAYKEYHRKPADLSNQNVQVAISAANLIAAYEKDETNANTLFLGKTILVTGNIVEITNQQDTLITVILGASADMHKVSCQLSATQKESVKNYTASKPILIKGICTGFLIDVELNRCVIVNEK